MEFSMRYVYASILIVFTVIAFYYATRIFYKGNRKRLTYRLLTMLSIASSLWSFGYAMMFLSSEAGYYLVYKSIGLVGLFWYVIFGQMIIGYLTDNMKKLRPMIWTEGILGVILFIWMSHPSTVIIKKWPDGGLYTEFAYASVAIAYTVYIVVCVLVFVFLSFKMAGKKYSHHIQAVGKSFLKIEGVVLIGMIFDTLLPAVGINFGVPGSTLLQFIGLQIVYYALHKYGQNIISMENVTQYIYHSLRTPVFVFDKNHTLMLANNKALEKLQVSENANLTKIDVWGDHFKIAPPEDIEHGDANFSMDINVRDDVYLRFTMDPIFNEYKDYLGYILVSADISEQVKNMQLQKNTEMKTQFLANMSHEIRTPLNAILGFNDALLQNSADKDKVKSYAMSIHEAGENLKNIINSILDISKIEMGQLEIDSKEYSTVELLDNIASMFELLAQKKGLAFNVDIDSNLPEVLIGDEQHLRQILINILNNAIKYTDSGAVSLRINVLEETEENPIVKIRFAVKDTGRGIREEDREKLFEKFGRLDTEHFKHTEGTGLGMSIVLHTLKAMGSEIQFDSVYGEGSEFYFVLEQVALKKEGIGDFKERRKENALRAMKSVDFRAPQAKILIVDDVDMNIDAACALLEFTQMQIDTALSGKAAIEAIRKKKYDIIFMDHMMPEMDGIQATEKIRELSVELNDAYYAMVPIIALTANAIVGMKEIFQQAGMQDFVSKPIEMNSIIVALKKWLPEEFIERATVYDTVIAKVEEPEEEAIDEWQQAELEGIDKEEAKRYNANFAGFEKNLRSFEKAYANNKKEISKYHEEGNVHDYVIKVHGLKSTSKMIGAMKLSEAARQIEEKGNAGEMVAEEFVALMELYDTCVEGIREYFHMDQQEEAVETENAISEEEYQELLERIKEAAENFDAGEFMLLEDELNELVVSSEHREELEALQGMISMLSFGAVVDYLQ